MKERDHQNQFDPSKLLEQVFGDPNTSASGTLQAFNKLLEQAQRESNEKFLQGVKRMYEKSGGLIVPLVEDPDSDYKEMLFIRSNGIMHLQASGRSYGRSVSRSIVSYPERLLNQGYRPFAEFTAAIHPLTDTTPATELTLETTIDEGNSPQPFKCERKSQFSINWHSQFSI